MPDKRNNLSSLFFFFCIDHEHGRVNSMTFLLLHPLYPRVCNQTDLCSSFKCG